MSSTETETYLDREFDQKAWARGKPHTYVFGVLDAEGYFLTDSRIPTTQGPQEGWITTTDDEHRHKVLRLPVKHTSSGGIESVNTLRYVQVRRVSSDLFLTEIGQFSTHDTW